MKLIVFHLSHLILYSFFCSRLDNKLHARQKKTKKKKILKHLQFIFQYLKTCLMFYVCIEYRWNFKKNKFKTFKMNRELMKINIDIYNMLRITASHRIEWRTSKRTDYLELSIILISVVIIICLWKSLISYIWVFIFKQNRFIIKHTHIVWIMWARSAC